MRSPAASIIAWEVFSELDLATGATEQGATAFVEKRTPNYRGR